MARERSLRESIMGIPLVYHLFQNGIRKPSSDVMLAREIIGCKEGMTILDIGCGVARIRKALGNVDYVGIDHNERYIARAKREFKNCGRFFVADVREVSDLVKSRFDRVLLIGVLHHLDDTSSRELIKQARQLLNPGGILVSYDPTFVPRQNLISYMISRLDRGRFVRTPEGYEQLLTDEFESRVVLVRNDLLRLPSSTVIISARPIT